MRTFGRGGLALVGLLGLLAAPVRADVATADARQRELIRTERAAAEAGYRDEVLACSRVFAVTACNDAARARRHATMTRLDRRLLALDEAARRQRAEERVQAIDSKFAGDEARRREEAARARAGDRGEPKAAKPAASAASPPAPRKSPAAGDDAARGAQEARARQAFEMKQIQAEAHRQEVERRNRERALKTNPAAPLPLPAAAAASS